MQKVPAQKQNLMAQWAWKLEPEGSRASDANAYCGSGLWPYSQLDDRPPEKTCVSTPLLSFQGTAPIESTFSRELRRLNASPLQPRCGKSGYWDSILQATETHGLRDEATTQSWAQQNLP